MNGTTLKTNFFVKFLQALRTKKDVSYEEKKYYMSDIMFVTKLNGYLQHLNSHNQ